MKGVLGIKKDKSGYVYYFNGREIYPRYINKAVSYTHLTLPTN